MKKLASKNDIKTRNGKKIILISAGNYLEVKEGLHQSEFEYLQGQLFTKLSTKVDLYAYSNKDPNNCGLVFKFETVEAAIFAYFLLEHYQKEAKFIRGARYFGGDE